MSAVGWIGIAFLGCVVVAIAVTRIALRLAPVQRDAVPPLAAALLQPDSPLLSADHADQLGDQVEAWLRDQTTQES